MREIKFRGFNRKNGVWLYGFYLTHRGAHFVCPDEFADGKSWDDYEIDPKTRGEYMGQKDKNGQEIYEGDKQHLHYYFHGLNKVLHFVESMQQDWQRRRPLTTNSL